MKKILAIAVLCVSLSGCGMLSKVNWDANGLASAAGSAMTAVSLSDEQIAELSAQSIAQLDAQATIDNGAYDKRLKKLMDGVTIQGLTLNMKVYKTSEVNAFACGDGSIRVYSGLMDVMDDDELMAIIGHEIGHVLHKDTKNAMKSAYLAAAARSVLASAGGVLGSVAQSLAGDIAQTYLSSQFSQKQEFAADQAGFEFAIATGHSPYSMCNALNKLVKLSNGAQASKVQQMFASHPDSETRAARMKEAADNYTKKK